jgi:hypothetical protein
LNRLSSVTDNRLVAQGAASAVMTYSYDGVSNVLGLARPDEGRALALLIISWRKNERTAIGFAGHVTHFSSRVTSLREYIWCANPA